MDLSKFINSTAISNHLDEIRYTPTPETAAYVIWQSLKTTIKERHAAFKRLLQETLDKKCESIKNPIFEGSLHTLIRSYIEYEEILLGLMKGDGNDVIYTVHAIDKDGERELPRIFKTYDSCLNYIQKLDTGATILRICRRTYGEGGGVCSLYVSPKGDELLINLYSGGADTADVFHAEFERFDVSLPLPRDLLYTKRPLTVTYGGFEYCDALRQIRRDPFILADPKTPPHPISAPIVLRRGASVRVCDTACEGGKYLGAFYADKSGGIEYLLSPSVLDIDFVADGDLPTPSHPLSVVIDYLNHGGSAEKMAKAPRPTYRQAQIEHHTRRTIPTNSRAAFGKSYLNIFGEAARYYHNQLMNVHDNDQLWTTAYKFRITRKVAETYGIGYASHAAVYGIRNPFCKWFTESGEALPDLTSEQRTVILNRQPADFAYLGFRCCFIIPMRNSAGVIEGLFRIGLNDYYNASTLRGANLSPYISTVDNKNDLFLMPDGLEECEHAYIFQTPIQAMLAADKGVPAVSVFGYYPMTLIPSALPDNVTYVSGRTPGAKKMATAWASHINWNKGGEACDIFLMPKDMADRQMIDSIFTPEGELIDTSKEKRSTK